MEPAFEGDTFTFFSLHLRLNLGGYIHFLTRCGWMWPFLIWVCPFFGWVWVGVTLFWLGVVHVGGCDLYLAGCGWVWPFFNWVWVDVGGCGWVWVGVGECRIYNCPLSTVCRNNRLAFNCFLPFNHETISFN